MQRKWYRSVLEKDIDAVNGTHGSLRRHVSISFFAPRSNWKGGKDTFNEHGYAGKLGDKLGVYILLIIYARRFAKWLIIHT
jgi:hypothetical protein